jgi:hypothetical protein
MGDDKATRPLECLEWSGVRNSITTRSPILAARSFGLDRLLRSEGEGTLHYTTKGRRTDPDKRPAPPLRGALARSFVPLARFASHPKDRSIYHYTTKHAPIIGGRGGEARLARLCCALSWVLALYPAW